MFSKIKILIIVALGLLIAGCSSQTSPTEEPTAIAVADTEGSMGGMASAEVSMDFAPPVAGLYEGEEILFIHTEVSDADVADLLTMMMGPQVVLVPQLAEAPETLLANVYVFTNGLEGGGPFGFQPDVFDSVPGDEAYRPLRSINLVAWEEGTTARELGSVEEIEAAEAAGEVTIERPGIVANMPIITWPSGQR